MNVDLLVGRSSCNFVERKECRIDFVRQVGHCSCGGEAHETGWQVVQANCSARGLRCNSLQ
jgi:hypothetical protein